MAVSSGSNRTFLFLQGPHGPFFHRLGKMLRRSGASVWRVGFNAGDRVFWPDRATYIPFTAPPETWPDRFDKIVADKGITDIVLYGDVRDIHATAIQRARDLGLMVHVFEEGYLRPYWVTYERGGSNGHSRLMTMPVDDMQHALEGSDTDTNLPPGHWGDMRQHVFYGALYHWFVMFRNGDYRNFQPHRALSVVHEFRLYLQRLLLMPLHTLDRVQATLRIRYGGFPYHLALL
ncbi:MAG: capsule biosynthesis protein CapA, partial [Rhodobacteraceae bacterium]|nr:capsule biosynthesis protein CapA [Paracoccaceae bacterium]